MDQTITMLPFFEFPSFFRKNVEYRLHIIRARRQIGRAIAKIYDGEEVIHTLRAADMDNAIERAKEWIDEQDEYGPEFDLHTTVLAR